MTKPFFPDQSSKKENPAVLAEVPETLPWSFDADASNWVWFGIYVFIMDNS